MLGVLSCVRGFQAYTFITRLLRRIRVMREAVWRPNSNQLGFMLRASDLCALDNQQSYVENGVLCRVR